jgi:hypothetical protein
LLSAPDLEFATMLEAVKLITRVIRNNTKPAAISAESPLSLASPYLKAIKEDTEFDPDFRI